MKMHMVSGILHLLKRVVICRLVLAALFLVSYCKFEIFKKVGLGPNNLQYCFGGKYIRTENIGLQVNFWKSTGTYMCFPGESAVKNPPAVFEMQAPTLGQEDPLEKEMATHSSIRAWEIPWTGEPGGLQSME